MHLAIEAGIGIAKALLYLQALDAPVTSDPKIGQHSPKQKNVTPWLVDTLKRNAASADTYLRPYVESRKDTDNIGALWAWVSVNKAGGMWDMNVNLEYAFKNAGNPDFTVYFGGDPVSKQAVTNLHFGFVGYYAGYSNTFLEFGAGVFQLQKCPLFDDDPRPECGGGLDTFYDNPYDNWWINFGYWLALQVDDDLDSLTDDLFNEYLNEYIGEFGGPPD